MSGEAHKVLPKLGDKRLVLAGKQSYRTRKLTSIVNESLKRSYTRYEKTVDKYAKSYEFKMWQNSMPIKNTMLRIRGTQKYLKRKRQSVLIEDDPDRKFGIYDGVSLDSMKHELEEIHQQAHPRKRRLRKIERLLENGKHDGRLVDYDNAQTYFEMVMRNEASGGFRNFKLHPASARGSSGSMESKLRLPPLIVNRDNSKGDASFERVKCISLPALFYNDRARTFTVESKSKQGVYRPRKD